MRNKLLATILILTVPAASAFNIKGLLKKDGSDSKPKTEKVSTPKPQKAKAQKANTQQTPSPKSQGTNPHAEAMVQNGLDYLYGRNGKKQSDKKAWEQFNSAMAQGSVEAQYYVAEMYNYGFHVEQDMTRYMMHLREAAQRGSVNAISDLGGLYLYGSKRAIVEKDEPRGVQLIRVAADYNHPRALVMLGHSYRYGKGGLQRDLKQAFNCYGKALDAGNIQGLVEMANCYLEGIGVDENTEKAHDYLLRAEQRGNSDASRVLGSMYFRGRGVERNDSMAAQYYKKAIRLGNTHAMSDLAWMYIKGGGGARFYAHAFDLFKEAAEKEEPEALGGMGLCYEFGLGTLLDVPLAISCYKSAAADGDSRSLHRLYTIYRYGNSSMDKDINEARKFLDEGVSRGNSEALFSLGNEYLIGEIFSQDTAKGLEYINKAADAGNSQALATLGNMYYSGDKYVERDFNKAFDYYKRAMYHPEDIDTDLLSKVYRNVSACYRFGRGTETNLDMANKYTTMSNHLGDREMGDVIRFYTTEPSF